MIAIAVVWAVLGITIAVSAALARRSARALRSGKAAVAVLFLGAGAAVNAALLAGGEDYREFADSSYLPFVTDTWRTLVVPHHEVFITLLVLFQAAVGALVLLGRRAAAAGLAAAVAFHVALLCFGWGFYLWSIPVGGSLVLLLRAQLSSPAEPAPPRTDRYCGRPPSDWIEPPCGSSVSPSAAACSSEPPSSVP